MIEFLSAGSYPHAIMLLVRLFILLKLFLFARLRSTDDTMLLTDDRGWLVQVRVVVQMGGD